MKTFCSNTRHQITGISLVECLIYIFMLMVIMTMAFSMYNHLGDSSRTLSRASGDVVRALDAGERWRDDLHAATGPVQLGEIEGGGQRLRIPQENGGVIYEFHDSAIWRQAGGETNAQMWLGRVKTSAMIKDARERVESWRWELEFQTRTNAPGDPSVKPRFTFEAVDGNLARK
jgi:hypothetical protein